MIYYSKRNKDWEEKLSDEFWNGFKAYIEEIVPLLRPYTIQQHKAPEQNKEGEEFLKGCNVEKEGRSGRGANK